MSGQGDPEKLYDFFELNINNLISWETGEMGVGSNCKCILCKVYTVFGDEAARIAAANPKMLMMTL